MTRPITLGRAVRGALFGTLATSFAVLLGIGCLDRPVAPATPQVTARVVELAKQNKVNKIDLLFMIDNSSSMADKQAILSDAVPDLVNRLIEPRCVDPMDPTRTVGVAVGGVCQMGELDFEPIKDIHIGIVSSSLGSHGAPPPICDDASDAMSMRSDPHNDDKGHLVSRGEMGGNVATFESKGFLWYNPAAPGGLMSPAAVATPFTSMVKGVGQHGCGYEASLEAVYRFLIEPDPYARITIDTTVGGYGQAKLEGTDTELLTQRRDFLRPDSLVSIMIVTDENDCSVVDGGQGFYAIIAPQRGTGRSVLSSGTTACLTNPNDRCCFNCGVTNPPSGCPSKDTDPQCMKGPLPAAEDQQNLRCFDQKRRYGVDFLYDVKRYVDGFSNVKVPNRKGEMVNNPLYSDLTCQNATGCAAARDKSLVFVAGIVGVPWQDIAEDPNNLSRGYKTAKKITDENIWANIVGDPAGNPPAPPKDMHMVESIKPRMGLPGPNSVYNADPINGHEWDPSRDTSYPNSDLQYACIFELNPPKPCPMGASDCDCVGSAMSLNDLKNPLCHDATGNYTNQQARAKAYPGTRILQVLQGIDPAQAIVASICPAEVRNKMADNYGYGPAIQALVGRLRNALRGRCLPRTLEVDENNQSPCIVVEAHSGKCECNKEPGRAFADPKIITDDMRKGGANCFCEILQLQGGGLTECKTNLNPNPQAGDGWCYVDPQQGANGMPDVAQCPVVRNCPATERRLIKFINPNSEPRAQATAHIMCQEKSFPSHGGNASAGKDVCVGM